MNRTIKLLLALSPILAACSTANGGGGTAGTAGTTGTGGATSTAPTLPCDVDTILTNNCQMCHGATPSYGAPMPLVTYADLQAAAVTKPSEKVYQLVDTRVHDDAAPMPQAPYPRLTSAEMATLDAWTQAGAPPAAAGSASCQGTGGSDGGTGGGTTGIACTPDIHLVGASPWMMPSDESDIYVCYGVDIPADGRADVVGFVPHIDNKKIVHHILLYQSDTAVSNTPTACSGALSVTGTKLLYGWAPGGTPFELPAEAGMPMDPTTHYYVQVHYNNIQALVGETDQSGFDLCSTTTPRANAADMVAFGTLKIDLPPQATTAADCSYTWPAAAGPVHAIAAFPHMHQLGASIWTKQNPTTTAGDMGKNDPWNFNNQPFMPIAINLAPGDTVETRCEWTNTTPNTVMFGEYTEDEMCFSFTMYYPRADSFKSWLQPSALSTCK